MNDPIRVDDDGNPFVVIHHSLTPGVAYAVARWLSERARNGAFTDFGYGRLVAACRAVDAQQALHATNTSSPRRTERADSDSVVRWLTTHETAELLEVTQRWIQKQCAAGTFEGAVRQGRDWMIPRAAVELRKQA